MTSSYSPTIRLQEPATGDQNNTWGVTLNTNFTLIDSALNVPATIGITGQPTFALTVAQGSADQARAPVYIFTGALTAACLVTIPTVNKLGWGVNNTTGGWPVILTTGAGANATIPAGGSWTYFECDGANVVVPNVHFGQVSTNNNAGYFCQDAGGVEREMIAIDASNITNIFNAGGAGIRFLAQMGNLEYARFAPATGDLLINTQNDYGKVSISGGGPTINEGWAYYTLIGGQATFGATTSQNVSVSLFADGKVMGLEFDALSDARLKSDIAPIATEAALRFVADVEPVTFHWNADETKKLTSGVVAQNLLAAGFDHLVTPTKTPQPVGAATHSYNGVDVSSVEGIALTANYPGMIAYLHAALRDALQRIVTLEKNAV